MDELKIVIYSKEKNEGKGIMMIAAFFFIPVISLVYSSIDNQSLGSLFGAAGFLVVALLIFFMGRFQNKKYNQLGVTPLTLTPSFCTIGNEFSGSIEIKRKNFSKVKTLLITAWIRDSSSESPRFEKTWESTIAPQIKFIENKTMLDFSFVIPVGKQPTGKRFLSNNSNHWEISFEFVERMDAIKRTWEIPVKI